MSKTVLFQTIQFRISTQFSFIWPIDRTLSGATTLGHSGLWSDGNEEVLCIPQSSSITRASPSNCLVSYPGHSLGGGFPFAEKQLVHSTIPANWVITIFEDVDQFLQQPFWFFSRFVSIFSFIRFRSRTLWTLAATNPEEREIYDAFALPFLISFTNEVGSM